MKKIVKATIHWISPEDGGRQIILPIGMRYCPIIVFEGNQTLDSLWSAEIYNTSINGRVSTADISYLSDEAPFNLLQVGSKFRLYEEQQVVAEGEIAA